MQDALLVVDVQVDFCEGGALTAYDTESLIDTVNGLTENYTGENRLVIFSRDWHPENHCSFKPQGGVWPVHCVTGTPGAAFHPRLYLPACHLVVSKATRPEVEAYSAFDGTGLKELLDSLGVRSLALCGIATEYCVLASYEDAVKAGFAVTVNRSAVRPVKPGSQEEEEALRAFAGE